MDFAWPPDSYERNGFRILSQCRSGIVSMALFDSSARPKSPRRATDGQGGARWAMYLAVIGALSVAGFYLYRRHKMADDQIAKRVVIVGGGLAGCTATLAAAQPGVEVVLIEKEKRLGGNSAKASSGINALNPPGGDSQELFER